MKKDIMNLLNEKIIEELQDENMFLKDLVSDLFKEISILEEQLKHEMLINDITAKMQEEELEVRDEMIFELKKELNKVDLLMMLQNKK
jgi:hypothetical protein